MKKLVFSVAIILTLSLAGCGSSKNKNEAEQNTNDATSTETVSTKNNETDTNVYQDYIESVSPIMEEISNFGVQWDELRQQSADGTCNRHKFTSLK